MREVVPRTFKYLVLPCERNKLNPTEAEKSTDDGVYMFRVHIREQPSKRIGILIGECLHNLRSALDHLVWQLAIQNGNRPDDKSEFPIFLDPGKFSKRKKDGDPDPQSGLRKMQNCSAQARTLIEQFQPFNRPAGQFELHPLWLLQKLNNVDKHQTIPVFWGMAPTGIALPGFGSIELVGELRLRFVCS